MTYRLLTIENFINYLIQSRKKLRKGNFFSIALTIAFFIIGQNSIGQNLTIGAKTSDKNDNEKRLDSELAKMFNTELTDALNLMTEIQNRDYKKVKKRLENTFAQKNWTKEKIKQKVDWTADLIFNYGFPIKDSIILSTSHPISWIINNSKEASGHLITFTFVFPDKINDGINNSVGITYSQREDQISETQKQSYDFFLIEFNEATNRRGFSNSISNFTSHDFAFSLDSALKTDHQKVDKLKLKREEFNLFQSNYIKSFPNLLELRIDYLKIDTVPDFVRKMTYLKVLKVNNNNLTSLPPWISELTKLEVLEVAYNKIKTVPKEIHQLKNVKTLELQWNNLSKDEVEKIKKSFNNIDLKIGQQE
jgi:hypothetical protein